VHCSAVTAQLLRIRTQCPQRVLAEHEIGDTFVLAGGDVSVTLLDANHCPGAAMALFELESHTVLYTGDFRFHPKMMAQPSIARIVGRIDLVVFDSTFCNPVLKFPKKDRSIDALKQVLMEQGERVDRVYIALEMLGCEEVLVTVAQEMGIKFYIDPNLQRTEQLVVMESTNGCITENPETKYHIIANYMISKVKRDSSSKLIIKPSTLWFARKAINFRTNIEGNISIRDGNVHHILFSMHSDFFEIYDFISALRPQNIQPMLLPVGYSSEAAFQKDLQKWFGEFLGSSEGKPFQIEKNCKENSNPRDVNALVKRRRLSYSQETSFESSELSSSASILKGKRVFLCSSIAMKERCNLLSMICKWNGIVEESLSDIVNLVFMDTSSVESQHQVKKSMKYIAKEGSSYRIFDYQVLTKSCSLDCVCAENYEYSNSSVRYQSWLNQICTNEQHACALCRALRL
jgi:mRNA degradation ribonuclease J1/J2